VRPGVLPLDQIANPNDVIRPDSVFWSTLRLAYQQRFHTALVPAECGGLGLKGLSMNLCVLGDFVVSLFLLRLQKASSELSARWFRPRICIERRMDEDRRTR